MHRLEIITELIGAIAHLAFIVGHIGAIGIEVDIGFFMAFKIPAPLNGCLGNRLLWLTDILLGIGTSCARAQQKRCCD